MVGIRKSLVITLAQQYGSAAIALVSVVVLARILTPTEIGIFSVSAAVISVAHIIRDFGIGRYLVQEPELTTDRFRTAYGIGIVSAWIIAAALFAGRGYVAEFYHEPSLAKVVAVLSGNFLLLPFGAPILWMLTREMKFGQLFIVNMTAQAVQATMAVGLAAIGDSFMSLAWASLAGAVVTTIMACVVDKQHAFLVPSFTAWRRVLIFGSWASAQSLIGELGNSATDIILGRTLGFDAVGLYSRASGIISTVNRDIIKSVVIVSFPAFAQLRRKQLDLHDSLSKGTAYLNVVVWPVIGVLAIVAFPLVDFLFGPNWVAAAPILQLLCASTLFSPLVTLASQALLAIGRIKTIFYITLVGQSLRVLMIILGSFFGLAAVAALQVIPALVGTIMWLWCTERATKVEINTFVKPCLQSIAVTGVSCLGPLVVAFVARNLNNFPLLAISGVLWILGWLAGIAIVRHPICEEIVRLQPAMKGALAFAKLKLW